MNYIKLKRLVENEGQAESFEEFFNLDANSGNQNEEDPTQSFKELRARGFINDKEYVKLLMRIAEETGQNVIDLLAPGERLFEIGDDGLGTEYDWLIDLLKEWTGPKGEKAMIAKGTVGESWFELDLIVSNGGTVKINWDDRSFYSPEDFSITVDGRTTSISEEYWDFLLNVHYEEDTEFEEYVGKLISYIVASAY